MVLLSCVKGGNKCRGNGGYLQISSVHYPIFYKFFPKNSTLSALLFIGKAEVIHRGVDKCEYLSFALR